MTVAEFIRDLSEQERHFIANLDYSLEAEMHQSALDRVIKRGGLVDHSIESWYPYEVIELGKNCLIKGHNREFVACAGIVLQNICNQSDQCNGWEISFSELRKVWNQLSEAHQALLEPLAVEAKSLDED